MNMILRSMVLITAVTVLTFISGICHGQITAGKEAPVFSLNDLNGKNHDLAGMKTLPLVIIYFFDVESRPSQEGLLKLDSLAKKYHGTEFSVLAITRSSGNKVTDFVVSSGIGFPVLHDDSKVSALYNAQLILPTICVVGPGLKVLDYFQGGGKTTEVMLVRIAERELQQKNAAFASALSSEVMKKDPANIKAAAVKGYAAMKENNLKVAEKVFTSLSKSGGKGEILGKEGLAAVYARMDQKGRAMELVEELENKAPDRSFPHVIRGDILYGQNKKAEAEKAYRRAVSKKTAELYQEGIRYNKLGRIYADSGEHQKARDMFKHAVTIDPYYIEGTTNTGRTYEKEGKWDKALASYRQALAVNKDDTFAAVLAKKAQSMVDMQTDVESKKRIDTLVKDLADRFRSRKEKKDMPEDSWTSRPMVLSFVDIQEKGGLSERDGFSAVLMSQLADHLNESGRVRVVERVVIERLLEELNLGSSDLADQDTALRLGKVLAARLIGTGSVFYLPQGTLLNLRLVDTETSAIPQITTRQIDAGMALEKELFRLNREILRTVITKYPLRGFIVQKTGDEYLVNIGSKQGVVPGTVFNVVEEQKPVTYKGKILKAAPKPVARLEVVRVEPDICYVRVSDSERPINADDKIQEHLEQEVL